ncbi:MAG TPA: ribonuclease E/G [Hyphomonadaceae bacterium]|jgi:hypothetical protein|nr:ribonuclease E/G [Hyphomonadaceae bacterium]
MMILLVDDAVGETRRALMDEEDRRIYRLEIERWSERDKRAKLDEIWWGRAHSRSTGNRGWFVDLGLEADGLLETEAAITEGALIPVRVKSESWAGKSATLSLADMPSSTPRPAGPQFHAAPKNDPLATSAMPNTFGIDARTAIDAAIEEALSRTAAISTGGRLVIEHTQALTAIDVDSAGRKGGKDFELELNMHAASEAARQIALRNIGGIVVVDFVTIKKDRAKVSDFFRTHLEICLGRSSQVLEISPIGLCEAAIARRNRPVADALGCPPEEREALDALRLIETEGRNGPERIEAVLSRDAAAWLERDTIGWQKALADRIGARWTIRAEDRPAFQVQKGQPPSLPRVWRPT